jgi:anti-sigma factor RsiW
MDCRHVAERADDFVAGEVTPETDHDIRHHLESCQRCREDVAARRALRERIRTAMERAAGLDPRPEFADALRARLQRAAETTPVRAGIRGGRWWALAAAVLIAVGAGTLYHNRSAAIELARIAVGDHKNCALQFRLTERPISLQEAARRYGATYRVVEQLPPDDIVTPAGVAHVLERHACVYEGRRFAHVVLEFRGERVSLLVTAGGGSAIGGRVPGSIDGMNVVSFEAGQQVVFIVGDVSPADLAAAVDEPLRQELARV